MDLKVKKKINESAQWSDAMEEEVDVSCRIDQIYVSEEDMELKKSFGVK